MTTLEKLERLVKEKDACVFYDTTAEAAHVRFDKRDGHAGKTFERFPAPTLTEAIDKAYEAAFPTRKLEPGDLFVWCGTMYASRPGELRFLDDGRWRDSRLSLSEISRDGRAYTIIGKAYDEPIEVKP